MSEVNSAILSCKLGTSDTCLVDLHYSELPAVLNEFLAYGFSMLTNNEICMFVRLIYLTRPFVDLANFLRKIREYI